MTFTATNPVVVGYNTEKAHYDIVFDNTILLKTSISDDGTTWVGKIASTVFGIHTISATGSGAHAFRVRNESAGVTNYTEIGLGNNAAVSRGYLIQTATNFTPGGNLLADCLLVENLGAGGISFSSLNAAGNIRFYTGASGTFRGAAFASGGFAWGSATDPGASNFLFGGVALFADGSVSAPSIAFANDPNTGFYPTAGDSFDVVLGGSSALSFESRTVIRFNGLDNGNGFPGPRLIIERNSAAGTSVAGTVAMQEKDGQYSYMWPDATSVWRTGANGPAVDGDTGGTIIGSQVSTLDTKDLLGDDLTPDEAMAVVRRTEVRRFRSKKGAYNGTIFHGIIADWSPAFAMDPDEAHPNGRVFNPVSAFGYSVLSMQDLDARVRLLEKVA